MHRINSKKKWWLSGLIILVLIIIGIIVLHQPPTPPPTVSVTKGDITEQVIASGQIIPRHVIQVKSRIQGNVEKMLVQEGDYVKKDQPLLTINPNPAPTDYAQAVGTVKQDEARLSYAKITYHRDQDLLTRQAIAASQVDQDYSNYKVADAQLQQDKVALELMTNGKAVVSGENIENLVTSPMDGYILSKIADVGDAVVPVTLNQAGSPLFVIANMNDLLFQGQVSQIDVGKLKKGMNAELQIAAQPDLKLTGKLEEVSLETAQQDSTNQQSAAQASGTSALFQPQSTIQNGFNINIGGFSLPADTTLRAGYQATASITIKQVKGVLILPQSSIHYEGNQAYVLLIGKPPKRQNITLGATDASNVQVLSGLSLGQAVLANSDPDADSSDQD